jgi:hypothetical protein
LLFILGLGAGWGGVSQTICLGWVLNHYPLNLSLPSVWITGVSHWRLVQWLRFFF